jgi:NAD(P)-dependent dehydrogenase (short-subunit alcohol dehydrogenase family)
MSKVIVVTGASAGVGRACVRAFAQRGYDVALLTRRQEGLAAAAAEVRAVGARASVQVIDVADYTCCGGRSVPRRGRARSNRRVGQQRHGVGVRVVPRHQPRGVRPRDGGHLWWLRQRPPSNVEAHRAAGHRNDRAGGVDARLPRHRSPAAYCADKHAIQGLCDSLRTELHHGGSRVHVAMVQLPALNTPS